MSPAVAEAPGAADAKPLIEVREVTRVFGAREKEALRLLQAGADRAGILERTGTVIALHQVSFDVTRGEILVVMGLSGSGKSTLLRCLNRLVEPSHGSIRVGGEDVTRMGVRELRDFRRRTFGMVFQHFALFPHRTVLENVEFGLEVQGATPGPAPRCRDDGDQAGRPGWLGVEDPRRSSPAA